MRKALKQMFRPGQPAPAILTVVAMMLWMFWGEDIVMNLGPWPKAAVCGMAMLEGVKLAQAHTRSEEQEKVYMPILRPKDDN